MKRNLYLGLFASLLALGGMSALASPALAQTAAPATAAPDAAARISAYKTLMEYNGTSQNVRVVIKNTKDAIRQVVMERAGKQSLTTAEETKLSGISARIMTATEATLLDSIAQAQAKGFTLAEIQTLIGAYSTPAAARYNAAKFANPDANAQQIQTYMVDAVVKIIKTYKETTTGDLNPAGLQDLYRLADAEKAELVRIQSDTAFERRVELTRQLLKVDGSEMVIRHFVSEVHTKLIVAEVGKYIDFNSLNDADRYRLAAIVATAGTELGDKIMNLTAQQYAASLSEADLNQLIAAMNTDAQRKLTDIRLKDDGSVDKQAETDLQIASLQIVQEYEKP